MALGACERAYGIHKSSLRRTLGKEAGLAPTPTYGATAHQASRLLGCADRGPCKLLVRAKENAMRCGPEAAAGPINRPNPKATAIVVALRTLPAAAGGGCVGNKACLAVVAVGRDGVGVVSRRARRARCLLLATVLVDVTLHALGARCVRYKAQGARLAFGRCDSWRDRVDSTRHTQRLPQIRCCPHWAGGTCNTDRKQKLDEWLEAERILVGNIHHCDNEQRPSRL